MSKKLDQLAQHIEKTLAGDFNDYNLETVMKALDRVKPEIFVAQNPSNEECAHFSKEFAGLLYIWEWGTPLKLQLERVWDFIGALFGLEGYIFPSGIFGTDQERISTQNDQTQS